MVPSVLLDSAMMVALPEAKALTMPALAPGPPPVLVLTGKSFGRDEIQVVVFEFVRSLTYGGAENVPIAKNCPVACNVPTVMELGMIESERMGSGGVVKVVLTAALPVTTDLSALVTMAVMVVLPELTPVANPVALTVAIEGMAEVHVIWGESVTSSSRPVVPEVASAINWPV
jgi:hypothetical protein